MGFAFCFVVYLFLDTSEKNTKKNTKRILLFCETMFILFILLKVSLPFYCNPLVGSIFIPSRSISAYYDREKENHAERVIWESGNNFFDRVFQNRAYKFGDYHPDLIESGAVTLFSNESVWYVKLDLYKMFGYYQTLIGEESYSDYKPTCMRFAREALYSMKQSREKGEEIYPYLKTPDLEHPKYFDGSMDSIYIPVISHDSYYLIKKEF